MENTIENNKLLAEFMKFDFSRFSNDGIIEFPNDSFFEFQYNTFTIEELKFHSDWNWLMEVVDKIETTDINNMGYIDFHIMPDAVILTDQDNEDNPLILINKSEGFGSIEIEPVLFESKIQAVYNACIKFVKWHNQQK